MPSWATLRVNHDDMPNDVVDRVNKLLKVHDIEFADDGKVHPGFMLYYVTIINCIASDQDHRSVEVERCQRCGLDHKVSFSRLNNPTDEWDWFGYCPVNSQPLLMRASEIPAAPERILEEHPDA